jgi:hypothetical protein
MRFLVPLVKARDFGMTPRNDAGQEPRLPACKLTTTEKCIRFEWFSSR